MRESQIALSLAIEQTIADKSTLIAEAGTGIGKTWAYLVPAYASQGKVMVSTGTRALQDQLFRKDMPLLKKLMGSPITIALLKGRANYLCHFHYKRLVQDADATFSSEREVAQLKAITQFFDRTTTGDKADFGEVPDSAPIWARVTSTRDNCLNQDCPHFSECFVAKARAKVRDADIIVVNHALFFADIVLKKEVDVDLLPTVDTVIFDEAHQLPDVATQFLGSKVFLSNIEKIIKEISIRSAMVKSTADWESLCKKATHALLDLRLDGRELEEFPNKKAVFEAIPNKARFLISLDRVLDTINHLLTTLNEVKDHHVDLQEVYNTLSSEFTPLHQWAHPEAYKDTNHYVRWVESGRQQLHFSRAPLSVKNFATFKRQDQAWVFTSATLSVNRDFTHFQSQLGLVEARCESWESPFRYAERAIMYVPSNLPSIKAYNYFEQFAGLLVPFIEKTPGGCLLLCTTLRAVQELGQLLENAFKKRGIKRSVLQQGQSSHRLLVDQFRKEKNAVLVGSASFWEGVDFPGDLLTLLAIDKLPFAPPDDPVLEARIDECRKRGGNPFMDIQIPLATIALKQGVGRLIRTEHDCGVLIIGDDRLVTQRYSHLLWNSLPDFYRTRDPQVALGFWG